MGKLQSSINKVDNLGTWSVTAVYISLILSCMFVPSILIKFLKVKWTLVTSIFCYSTYMAAQFYPEFYTLIPTALLLGLGAAPLWSAKCTYLNQVLASYMHTKMIFKVDEKNPNILFPGCSQTCSARRDSCRNSSGQILCYILLLLSVQFNNW